MTWERGEEVEILLVGCLLGWVLQKSHKLLMWLKTYYSTVWLVTLNWNKAEHLATIYTKDILLLGNILLEFVVGCEILIKAT